MSQSAWNIEKKKRPAWFVRMCATALDVGLCAYSMALIYPGIFNHELLAILLVCLYYYFCESTWGRTPGKMILRMKVVTKKGEHPKRGRFILRTFLRLGTPLMMLSWRRTTLLDLLSGCRVQWQDVPLTVDDQSEVPKGWR